MVDYTGGSNRGRFCFLNVVLFHGLDVANLLILLYICQLQVKEQNIN